jgi:hypothetical protein
VSARNRAKREGRRAAFDRIHGEVLKGRTIRDLYLTYGRNRFRNADEAFNPDDEAVKETIEHAFYAGAGSMLEMMTRVGPDAITEDQGVEMLTRLHEELDAYTKRGRTTT